MNITITKRDEELFIDYEDCLKHTFNNFTIVGDFVGCFHNDKPFCLDTDSEHISNLSINEILNTAFGKFIIVESKSDQITIHTSKSMNTMYYTDLKDGVLVTTDEKRINISVDEQSINYFEIELQLKYFYRSPFSTFVDEVKQLPLACSMSIDNDTNQMLLTSWLLNRHEDNIHVDKSFDQLQKFARVVKRSNRNVVLYLSGGIDSSLILAELLNENVTVKCIVMALKFRNKVTISPEIADSFAIAHQLNVDNSIEYRDLKDPHIHFQGEQTGWKWGYPYFSESDKSEITDNNIYITGLGEAMYGVEHVDMKFFKIVRAIINPLKYLKNYVHILLERAQYSHFFNRAISSVGKHEIPDKYINVLFGAVKLPPPRKNYRSENFSFNETESTIAYRIKDFDLILAPIKNKLIYFTSWLKYVKLYQYQAAAQYNYDRTLTLPYIDLVTDFVTHKMTLLEVIIPKRKAYKRFRHLTGKNYHSIIPSMFAKKQIARKNILASPPENMELDKLEPLHPNDYYLNNDMKNTFYSLFSEGMLKNAISNLNLKTHFEEVFKHYFSKIEYKHQPQEVVNILRYEMFLRNISDEQ